MPWNRRENTRFVSDVAVWGQSRPPTTDLQTRVLRSTLTAASPLCPRSPTPPVTASAVGPELLLCVGLPAAPTSELTSWEMPFTTFRLTQLQQRPPCPPLLPLPTKPGPMQPPLPPQCVPLLPPALAEPGQGTPIPQCPQLEEPWTNNLNTFTSPASS